jgi:cell division protein ZapD
VILYEYPFNERIRAYLRLEHLFDRLFYFARPGDAKNHQIALTTIFDILDASERTDIKSSVHADVERQRLQLAALRGHPGVDQDALEKTLADLERASTALSSQGKAGQSLRQNDWLTSLRGRLAVPGGATQIEMPSYYAWQHKPEEARVADLQAWMDPLLPLQNGVAIGLRLLRGSGRRSEAVAEQGAFQQMLAGKTHQLLRVWLDEASGVFPEMSANKYMIWIRFSAQDTESKPQQVTRDVPFLMSLCSS